MQYILSHSAKGTTWKKHKYIKKENGRYVYNRSDREKNLKVRDLATEPSLEKQIAVSRGKDRYTANEAKYMAAVKREQAYQAADNYNNRIGNRHWAESLMKTYEEHADSYQKMYKEAVERSRKIKLD